MNQDRSLKTKILPLPRSTEDIVELLRRVLGLGFVQEIRINPTGIVVQRHVHDGEDVLPEEIDPTTVDANFLLEHLAEKENLVFDPGEHSYIRLYSAFQKVQSRRLKVVAILAPNPEIFGAFLGLEEDARPDYAFGVPALYLEGGAMSNADKCVVVGSPTLSIRDAVFGIIVDMGE